MKRIAKRPNEHDDFDAGETTGQDMYRRKVPPRSEKATHLKGDPRSGSKQAPSCVRANQIVCQFPNANCAILVSHEYRNSQSTQAHQASFVQESIHSPYFAHDKKKPFPLILLPRAIFVFFSCHCFATYNCLSSDGDGLAAGGNRLGNGSIGVLVLVGFGLGTVSLTLLSTGLALEEAALLDGAAGLDAGDRAVVGVLGDVTRAVHGGREVGDVLGDGVLRADGAGIDTVALAGLGHGVVARVKVLSVLEMLGEVVGAGGQLAVQTEETLLLGGERLCGGTSVSIGRQYLFRG